jgi:methylmalonyl-CoA mutase N-terminal domain/subunit
MDEALALPTDRAARIALRTQQVIAHETNVAHVADPLGGSWFVEHLTDELQKTAEEILNTVADKGGGSMLEGCIKGIEDNWFQSRIADSAYELERTLNTGERIVVGVNRFMEGNDDEVAEILRITREQEQRQCDRLRELRHSRDTGRVEDARAVLAKLAAQPEANLMPALIDAARAQVTLGEMMATLGSVFGRHVETPSI